MFTMKEHAVGQLDQMVWEFGQYTSPKNMNLSALAELSKCSSHPKRVHLFCTAPVLNMGFVG